MASKHTRACKAFGISLPLDVIGARTGTIIAFAVYQRALLPPRCTARNASEFATRSIFEFYLPIFVGVLLLTSDRVVSASANHHLIDGSIVRFLNQRWLLDHEKTNGGSKWFFGLGKILPLEWNLSELRKYLWLSPKTLLSERTWGKRFYPPPSSWRSIFSFNSSFCS